MCTCNGKQVRYLIYKRNTLLATCNSEEEALQAAKEVRGYVCVDVTEDKSLGLANSSRHPLVSGKSK